MRNLAWKNWLIAILAIIVASGSVALWLLKSRVSAERAGAVVVSPKPGSEIGTGASTPEQREELARLRKENAQLSNRLAEIASMHEPQMNALSASASDVEKSLRKEIETRRLAETRKPAVFDLDGSLSQEFCDAYGLDSADKARLQETFRTAIEELRRLSSVHTRGRYLDADTYELALSPFPREGGEVHDRLMNDVKSVIGTGRYHAFVQTSADEIERRFGGLGTKKTTLKVRWNEARKQYDIEEVETTSGGTPTVITSAAYVEVLDGQYPHLSQLLPAELRARSTLADFEKRLRR
jgi:hypothetical protein